MDTDIKALAVRVIDVPCRWSDVLHERVVEGDGRPAVVNRMHVAIGNRNVGAIRKWMDEKQFRHDLFQRVLVDPANGTRTKVDTIIRFVREADAMLFKFRF